MIFNNYVKYSCCWDYWEITSFNVFYWRSFQIMHTCTYILMRLEVKFISLSLPPLSFSLSSLTYLWQIDIVDWLEHQDFLSLFWVFQLQISGGCKDRFDSPHAVVVVMLGRQLLWTQSVCGYDFSGHTSGLHEAHRVERNLCNHGIVRDHHCHCSKQHLEQDTCQIT